MFIPVFPICLFCTETNAIPAHHRLICANQIIKVDGGRINASLFPFDFSLSFSPNTYLPYHSPALDSKSKFPVNHHS